MKSNTKHLQIVCLTFLCCLVLTACVSNLGLSQASLEQQLSGRTIEFDPPPGLPATRTTYNADGTTDYTFRPYFVPEKLGKGSGHWWIEKGRYCSAKSPRNEVEEGSCYKVTITGERVRFVPYNPPTFIRLFPEFRTTREGRFVS